MKREIGEFVVDQVLQRVGQGKSPLQGTPTWRKLNPSYAEEKKGGDRTPNLELTGKMLNAFTYRETDSGLEIGFFDDAGSDVLGKADGHNNFTGQSTLPLRRFIPKENESFYDPINRGIKDIIRQSETRESRDVQSSIRFPDPLEPSTAISLNDLLGRTLFDRIFADGES